MRTKWLPVSDVDLDGNERNYLLQAFDSGWLSGSGLYVESFEKEFASFCGARYGLSCANGTIAIHLALLALGIGPGDEVIVPSLTYIATANAVVYCGAKPVFADSHPDTWNVSVETIEMLLTERTRAIIVVPLYGNPVDMDPINALSERHGLYVIEDAAEAHGAEYKSHRCGTLGDLATFSFYGNKLITTGEGGMVLGNDPVLMEKMRLLRGQGMDPKRRYWFPVTGYNYRLTNLQCAIGLAQVERLPEFLVLRRRLAADYSRAFAAISGVTLQTEQVGGTSAWWMFSIRLPDQDCRDRVMAILEQSGIESRPLFWPLHMLPPYIDAAVKCPVAEQIGLTGINLPTGGHVSPEDIDRIVALVARAIG